VDQVEPGVWILKLGQFIPDSERWLFEPETERDLDAAIEWAKNTPLRASDLKDFERRAGDE
jgi:hypothetical protein